MPEFCEVNKQVRWLRERVEGWVIDDYGYKGKRQFAEQKDLPDGKDVLDRFFKGATIERVTQRGKFVVLRLSTGVVLAHLMFKGRWSIAGDDFISNYKHHKEPPTEKSANFWALSNGRRLNFHEPENLGAVHAFPGAHARDVEELRELGPEGLITPETDPDYAQDDWTVEHLKRSLKRKGVPVKAFLLDQKMQAGLGNMYVCESLYRAGVSPERPANAVTDDEAQRIYDAARAILRESIDTDLDYGRVLKVYRKEKDPEGRAVVESQVGGRDTFWVPEVQK